MELIAKKYFKKLKKIKRFIFGISIAVLFFTVIYFIFFTIDVDNEYSKVKNTEMDVYSANKNIVYSFRNNLNRVANGAQAKDIVLYKDFFQDISDHEKKDNPFVDFLIVK